MDKIVLPNFVGDDFYPAVVANVGLLQKALGYKRESDVPIKRIVVASAYDVETFLIGESKYKSALWVDAWFKSLSQSERRVVRDHFTFVMTSKAQISARRFFGEQIYSDAGSESTKHGFVRALLHKEGEVTVYFQ